MADPSSEDDDPDEAAARDVEEPPGAPPVPEARVEALQEQVLDLEQERDELAERVEELEAENEELTERVARARADYQNYKDRADRQKREAAEEARAEMAGILVEVSDNVDRALEADPSPDVAKGLELVQRTIEDELDAVGVERVEPEPGDAFDPTEHEAVVTEPTGEHEPETILERLAPGYRLGDRQIRPAMVKVAADAEE